MLFFFFVFFLFGIFEVKIYKIAAVYRTVFKLKHMAPHGTLAALVLNFAPLSIKNWEQRLKIPPCL